MIYHIRILMIMVFGGLLGPYLKPETGLTSSASEDYVSYPVIEI